MKANELMIGDWVYDKILKSNARVEALQPLTIKCDIHIRKHIWEEFEPVELTSEILEKNGFKDKDADLLYTFYDGWNFEIHNKTMMVSCGSIWYVHELQRVLRCCDLWDLANNFKII